ncbi:hypothetical protein [Stutzerimonas kunmingensis]|uniref:hypothetical protein n=1 Tax=Stutzerimonas kunmingensis TaxID=1211807 RepID=UPI00241F75E0|nr:hypothetical protein [Stutzerimonas kunmingensis]
MREVERSETRMAGARLFGSFWGDCQKELAQQRETKVSEHSEKGLALFRHLDGRASGTGSSRGVAKSMIGFFQRR